MAVLSDFTEGFIGKMQIRKSGKVQLVIGDVTLDVSEGAAFSFLQVSLHTAAWVKIGCLVVGARVNQFHQNRIEAVKP